MSYGENLKPLLFLYYQQWNFVAIWVEILKAILVKPQRKIFFVIVTRSLAELGSSVFWKLEITYTETEYLEAQISKHCVEGVALLLLNSFVNGVRMG